MSKYNSNYIKSLSKENLLKELKDLNMNLIRERSKVSGGGAAENTMSINGIKKKIAIINTVLNQ